MKVVLNSRYGGMSLSDEGVKLYEKLSGKELDIFTVERHDPILVRVVEELGREANSHYSSLFIQELPDGCEYSIEEYDGMESISSTWVCISREELIRGLSEEVLDGIVSRVDFVRVCQNH